MNFDYRCVTCRGRLRFPEMERRSHYNLIGVVCEYDTYIKLTIDGNRYIDEDTGDIWPSNVDFRQLAPLTDVERRAAAQKKRQYESDVEDLLRVEHEKIRSAIESDPVGYLLSLARTVMRHVPVKELLEALSGFEDEARAFEEKNVAQLERQMSMSAEERAESEKRQAESRRQYRDNPNGWWIFR